jgi:hypothetical protein
MGYKCYLCGVTRVKYCKGLLLIVITVVKVQLL